jgi:hypothetical protein
MQASLAQITQIKVFADDLETTDKLNLQPYTVYCSKTLWKRRDNFS